MKQRLSTQLSVWLFMGVFILYSLMPLYLMFSASFKTPSELFKNVISLPSALRWGNYFTVWTRGKLNVYFWNSVIISLPSVFLVLICSSLAGYAFAKMEFRGNKVIFLTFLLGLMIPIPSYNGSTLFQFK